MNKELQHQTKNGNFTILLRDKLPEETQVLPIVWQMKRKHNIKIDNILKHKARLNLDGLKIKKGI